MVISTYGIQIDNFKVQVLQRSPHRTILINIRPHLLPTESRSKVVHVVDEDCNICHFLRRVRLLLLLSFFIRRDNFLCFHLQPEDTPESVSVQRAGGCQMASLAVQLETVARIWR